jgi:hypothetical protein
MSEVQGANEGTQGTYLPQAAEVDVPAVRQNQDAKAKVDVGPPAPRWMERSQQMNARLTVRPGPPAPPLENNYGEPDALGPV